MSYDLLRNVSSSFFSRGWLLRKTKPCYPKARGLAGILPSDIFVSNPVKSGKKVRRSVSEKLSIMQLADELNIPQETRLKIASYVKKLYKFTMNNSREVIEYMQKTFGDIVGIAIEFRSKSNESMLEKIYRKIIKTNVKKTELQKSFDKAASQKEEEKLQALIDEQDRLRDSLTNNFAVIRNQLKDALGGRFILSKLTAGNINKLVNKIIAGIENDEFVVTHIKNYATDPEHFYFKNEQVNKILNACHNKGRSVNNIEKFKDSGYTTTQLCLVFKNNVRCELQIRDYHVHRIAEAEHYLYGIREQKNIGVIEKFLNPVYTALKKIDSDPALKKSYEDYLKECYRCARDGEMSTKVNLPENIPRVLDMENIMCMREKEGML